MDEAEEQREPTKPSSVQIIWQVCKWVIPALAILYLWREGTFSASHLQLSGSACSRLPAAVLFLCLATLAVALRFHFLLRRLGVASTIPGQLWLNFPGLLVQQIASDAAFDAVRILGARRMGGKGATIFAALMADRVLGLLALTTIACAGLAWSWKDSEWLYAVLPLLLALVLLPAAFIACAALKEKGHSWTERIPGFSFLASTGSGLKEYRHSVPLLISLYGLSCLAHMCMFMALYFCGQSLLHATTSPSESIVGGAMSSFTTILPLPMAGLGVGEAAFGETVAAIRGDGEKAGYAAVFLTNRFLLLSLGAVSWLCMAIFKKDK